MTQILFFVLCLSRTSHALCLKLVMKMLHVGVAELANSDIFDKLEIIFVKCDWIAFHGSPLFDRDDWALNQCILHRP